MYYLFVCVCVCAMTQSLVISIHHMVSIPCLSRSTSLEVWINLLCLHLETGEKMGKNGNGESVCMCDRVGVYRRVICVLNLLFTHGVQNRWHLNTITCPPPHRLSDALTMLTRNSGGQSNRAVFDSE